MSKKMIYPAGLIVAAFIAFFMYQKYYIAPTVKLNELSLTDLNGQTVNLENYRGKKVVLCFGASWCGNCYDELDMITAVSEKDLQDVEVIVISDETVEKVKRFKERRGYSFTFLKMNKTFSQIGINSIPVSYIVNKDFEVKKETVGYLNWKDPSTLHHLKKLME